MFKKNIGFIGLGLIGGSIAKAIRQKYPYSYIIAYDVNKNNLTEALEDKTLNSIASAIDKENFGSCDYIFLCAPVSFNAKYLETLKDFVAPNCIITDVGSVKSNIHQKVIELDMEANFIGGHPMAGSEKSGFSSAVAHLIENAYYVITPSSKVPATAVDEYSKLVHSLGAIPLIMSYEEHDYVTGAISHLPHIIASGLVNFVKSKDSNGTMKTIAAGGFKDITRIASSSPEMWQHICETNKENIVNILDDYIKMLEDIRNAINASNSHDTYNFFATARDYRNSIPNTSAGPIKKVYEIYCDIIDETGAIGTIATLLANNSINIRNIGIIHNREFEQGVLRIEFYEEEAQTKAYILLKENAYSIYER